MTVYFIYWFIEKLTSFCKWSFFGWASTCPQQLFFLVLYLLRFLWSDSILTSWHLNLSIVTRFRDKLKANLIWIDWFFVSFLFSFNFCELKWSWDWVNEHASAYSVNATDRNFVFYSQKLSIFAKNNNVEIISWNIESGYTKY